MRNEEFRCHPLMVVSESVRLIIATVAALLGGILSEFYENLRESKVDELFTSATEEDVPLIFILFGIAALFAVTLLMRFFAWRRTYLTITDESFIYDKRTLFFKKRVKVRLSGISTVNLQRTLIDRVFGTCTVKLDISSGATAEKTDFRLVFKKDFALRFEKEILAAKQEVLIANVTEDNKPSHGVSTDDRIVSFSAAYVIRHALLQTPIGVILVFGAILAGFAIPVVKLWGALSAIAFFVGFPAAVLLMVGADIIKKFVGYYGFTLTKNKKELNISYGLITKQSFRLPFNKTNAVVIKQSFLCRIFRMYYAEILNVGVDDEKEKASPILCLAVNRRQMEEILKASADEFANDFKTKASPPKAYIPQFVKSLFIAAMAGVIYWLTVTESNYIQNIVFICLLLFACVGISFAAYRAKGISVGDRLLTVSNGVLKRRTVIVPFAKIQSLEIKKGPISGALGLRKGRVSVLASNANKNNNIGYFAPDVFEKIAKKTKEQKSTDWRV